MTSTVRPSCPGFFGARPYPFLVDPLSYVLTRPRLPLDNKRTTPVRRPQGIACPLQHSGCFTVPSSTSPRRPRDGLHVSGHVATAISTAPVLSSPPRHPLGFFVDLAPPLETIKGEDKELSGGDRRTTSRSTSQAILHFSLLRLGTSSLSRSL
jgi:hypothetical protein